MFKPFKEVNKYLYFLLGITVIFSIGIVLSFQIGKKEEKKIRNEMLVLTQTFANVLNAKEFKTLQLDLSNKDIPEYKHIREKLIKLADINKAFGIKWIYTMVPVNEQIVFSVDSISEESPDYSDPGDTYTDASPDFVESINEAWLNKISSITEPYTDRWGNFITTIVPVVDEESGEVVSVLASDMEYTLFYVNKINNVKKMITLSTVFSLIIFSFVFFYVIYLKREKENILRLTTKTEKAEKSLKADDIRMKAIISSMGEGLLIINRQHIVTLINPRALELLGYKEKEVIGKDIRSVITIIKNKKEIAKEDWPTEKTFKTNQVVTTSLEDDLSITTDKQKSHLAVTFSISPLNNDSENDLNKIGLVVVVRDANKDRELDRTKSGFISIASHQLRTPLTSIRWYSEMLLSGSYGVLTEPQKDLVKEMSEGVKRLYQTINLLLGISRVESGKMPNEKSSIDLTLITTEVIKELTPMMIEKKLVYFSFSAQTDPIIVRLNPMVLRQVILNLFANSIRYTNNNGTIEGRWLIDKDKNEVVYSVRDNGIGIPKEAQSKIFSKFYRAENAMLKIPDGTGLGLAFVKDIVIGWGGRVWFETEEGEGTTFFFTIPIVVD
jgi:PAS domain S-box-containing protein